MERSDRPKVRVLCLHGYLTNADVMERQLREWKRVMGHFVEFIVVDGNYEVKQEEIIDVRIKKLLETSGKKSFTWHRVTDKRSDFLDDLRKVTDLLEKHAPINGILGFSQGGCCTNSFLQSLLSGELKSQLPTPLNFAILSNATFIEAPPHLQLNIPSLHLVSKEDDLYDKQLTMSTFYNSPIIIQHSDGHKIPRLSPRKYAVIIKFIQQSMQLSSRKREGGRNQPRL